MSRLTSPSVLALSCCTLAITFGATDAQERELPTAAEVQTAESAPLFASHVVLSLTLEADFHTIRREDRSDEDSEERPAVMMWTNADGSSETQEIQIQTRGIFRLSRRNCDFPPLRLNVKKEPTKGTLFEGQDKLKLVVTCKLNQDYWEQYVLAEHLVYRMLNLFTPLSFQVRLAKVTYIDSSQEDETFTRYAFLIEDDDIMATRNNGWKLDWETGRVFHPARLEKRMAILVDVFQYMIGNTDWSGAQMHNMELFQSPPSTFVTVPYDFDMSGIIDTRYARPDATLTIRSVRDRLFRGFCPREVSRDPADYEEVYEEFRQRKDEIYEMWRNQEDLDQGRLQDTLEYLDDFFETLDSPRLIEERMMRQCRSLAVP